MDTPIGWSRGGVEGGRLFCLCGDEGALVRLLCVRCVWCVCLFVFVW